MKRYLSLSAALLVLCISSLVFAVEAEETIAAAVEPNKPAEKADKDIAVWVNGQPIKEQEVEALVAPQMERIATQLPPQFVEQYKEQLKQRALDGLVVEKLFDAKVKEKDVQISDKEVEEKISELAAAQQPPLSVEDFKALVAAYGRSFDEVKAQISKGLSYQKLLEAEYGDIKVTVEDANQFYIENKAEFEAPEQVKASHILIRAEETEDPNSETEAKAAAREKAEDLLKEIKEGGDFAEFAKQHSACPSGAQGGDLGFFTKGQMTPTFEEAAFSLKVGQISGVVETPFGYHIIKVTDKKPASLTPFDEVKNDITEMLKQRKLGEQARVYIEKLKADAKIVYPEGKAPAPMPEPEF